MNNLIINIDVSGLRSLYKSDATARHILESLAERQNNWKMTTVSSFYSIFKLVGFDIPRKEIVRTSRELERLNCCEFVIGKVNGDRNFQSRIVWKVPPAIVGKLALDKKSRG